MKDHTFPLSLDEIPDLPLFLRITQAVVRDIARGRLRAGDALPGSRTLAGTLRVHRSTVVAAYAELAAQGWVEAKPGGTTFVAKVSPEIKPRRFVTNAPLRASVPSRTGFRIKPAPVPMRIAPPPPDRGTINLRGGLPDLRLVPSELMTLLARAYRRAIKQHGSALLGYTWRPLGHPRLRSALADLVCRARGLATTAESLMVTRGSQMALDLIARALVEPGDIVAVEALSYPNAVGAFRRAGAVIVPIRLDSQGLDVADLERVRAKGSVRLVYITPHHQYPTTVTLSPRRRLALLDLARREQFAIVEDDYDQEFHYDGRPVLPLASCDSEGNVIYIGTLAKILAPGLRLGFVVAPEPLIARLAAERFLVDLQGDVVVECAVSELIEDGEIQRHARRVRRIYHARRDAFCDALDHELDHAISYRRPSGGLVVWARVSPEIDVEAWRKRALGCNLHFQIGSQFSVDGTPTPHIRLGYAGLNEQESPVAVRRLLDSIPGARTTGRRSPIDG